MKKRIHITVHGRVQGVFFRAYTEKKALSLGIKGTVQNKPNGTVFIDAEGEESAIASFTQWCWQGAPLSSVTNVEVTVVDELQSYSDFRITR